MSFMEDSIDWRTIEAVDNWLDSNVGGDYPDQPLAQDWARISKVAEELGEAIQAFIGATGQNPRKGVTNNMGPVMEELADTALTAIFAMQHFTKSSYDVRMYLMDKQRKIYRRMMDNIK